MRVFFSLLSLFICTSAQSQPPPAPWRFLMPNQYHSNEAPTEPGTGWLALVTAGGVWRLEPTEVRATRVVDPVVDGEEGQKTGIQISSDHETALTLLRIPGIKPGKVDPPDMKFKSNPREISIAGGPLKISFKGADYVIEPTKAGIFLKKGTRQMLLAELPQENSENTNAASLLWAGDLDGDGQIDLLFSYSGENKFGACLYLSAGASKDALVRQAACHGGVGC